MKNEEKYSLKDLKVAVINEDLEALAKYSAMEFDVSSIEEAEEMLHYIELAKNIINREKVKLSKEMQQMRKVKNYTNLS